MLETIGHRDSLAKFMGLLVKAWIFFDSNEEKKGRTTLAAAFAMARAGKYIPGSDLPRVTAFLCAKALEYNIETEHVKKVIKTRSLAPGEKALHLETWPRPVHIRTLGRFEICRQGQPVSFPRKPKQKPLEMLKALISLGGGPVSQDRIADILWPDMDGDKAA